MSSLGGMSDTTFGTAFVGIPASIVYILEKESEDTK